MYLIVSKLAGAADTNAGVPYATSSADPDEPLVFTSCVVDGDGLTITRTGAGWSGVTEGDYIVVDPAGSKDLAQVSDITGDVVTVSFAVAGSKTTTVNVGGHLATITGALARVARMYVLQAAEAPIIHVGAGTYAEDAAIVTAGTAALPVTMQGFTSAINDTCTGTNRPLIDGGSARTNCISVDAADAAYYYKFLNLRCANSTASAQSGGKQYMQFRNCAFYSCGGYGINPASYTSIFDCDIYSNTSYGIASATYVQVVNSRVHDNAGVRQIDLSTASSVIGCQVWGMPTNGVGVNIAGAYGTLVVGCTIDGETKPSGSIGISTGGAYYTQIINCIVTRCATGIVHASTRPNLYLSANNCLYDNTSNYGATPYYDTPVGEVTSNPLFVDQATNDYRLQSGSPCKGTGTPAFMDIGALQREEAAAGGALILAGMGQLGVGVF